MTNTLLLVDDEEDLLIPLRVLLEEQYSILTARNGDQALELLAAESIDMIISDQRMPGMTGVELLTRVCELYPEIVRIIVTGYTDVEVAVRAINEGQVYRYINKPWSVDDMQLVIQQGLEWRDLVRSKGRLDADLSHAHKALAERNRELKAMQSQLVKNAHKAGMAEMTAMVLHNVNNVLNSVIVSGQSIVNLTESKSVEMFSRANKLLRDNMENVEDFIINDPKGKRLLEFYLSFETAFEELNVKVARDAKRLMEMVDAIIQVIVAQQSATVGGLHPEFLSASDVIDTAVAIHRSSLSQRRIAVEKNFDDVPLVRIQKTKLIHIMINLLKNAWEAMNDTAPDERKIIISINRDEENVCVKVADVGCGISDEDLPKVFSHGFTTKVNGHGFGLESCAHYMREMDGEIKVESAGVGQGATFIMTFPIPQPGAVI